MKYCDVKPLLLAAVPDVKSNLRAKTDSEVGLVQADYDNFDAYNT